MFSSEEEKFDALDKMMNDVYQAVRAVTPPDRFAKVKQEQIAWLKTRDAALSPSKKKRSRPKAELERYKSCFGDLN